MLMKVSVESAYLWLGRCLVTLAAAVWPVTGKWAAVSLPPPKFYFVGKFSSFPKILFSKYKIRGWKSPILGEFVGKLKFRVPIISSVVNLQVSVEKLQPPRSRNFCNSWCRSVWLQLTCVLPWIGSFTFFISVLLPTNFPICRNLFNEATSGGDRK